MSGADDAAVEAVLRDWLGERELTVFCGNWAQQGSLMELLPQGAARLSGPKYAPPFHGLRELRLQGSEHHVHLDLQRLPRAWYVLVPSVCHGFRPSFELRLAAEGQDPRQVCGLGLSLGGVHRDSGLCEDAVRRYLQRAARHLAQYPAQVGCVAQRQPETAAGRADWDRIAALLDDPALQGLPGLDRLRAALQPQAACVAA